MTLTYLKDCRVQTKQKCTHKQSYKTHPLCRKQKPLSCLFTSCNEKCVNDQQPIPTYYRQYVADNQPMRITGRFIGAPLLCRVVYIYPLTFVYCNIIPLCHNASTNEMLEIVESCPNRYVNGDVFKHPPPQLASWQPVYLCVSRDVRNAEGRYSQTVFVAYYPT